MTKVYLSLCLCVSIALPASAQQSTGKLAAGQTSTPSKSPSKNTNNSGASQAPQSPVKLYGQVNELLSACANAGVEITSTTLPARIKKVRMGSAAFYGGLQDNDEIVKGTLNNSHLHLTIKRGAATYAINLATESGALIPNAVPNADSAKVKLSSGTEKQATTKDPAWKKLKNYEIVILIDQSGSMGDVIDANGTTKWDWCSKQLTNFASQALVNTGRHFTIVAFNNSYVLRRECSPDEVHQTFVKNSPRGGTDLATPLDVVLKDYMKGPRVSPLLVVVLTDGMPARVDLVEQSIIDVTKRMTSPDQIKLVFFEIGNDADGAAVLRLLDFDLLSEGARYDIVDANSFDRLQEVGLKQALYDTFIDNFLSKKSPPTVGLQDELEAIRKQLHEARAREGQTRSNR